LEGVGGGVVKGESGAEVVLWKIYSGLRYFLLNGTVLQGVIRQMGCRGC
jgi:hypothetical protein